MFQRKMKVLKSIWQYAVRTTNTKNGFSFQLSGDNNFLFHFNSFFFFFYFLLSFNKCVYFLLSCAFAVSKSVIKKRSFNRNKKKIETQSRIKAKDNWIFFYRVIFFLYFFTKSILNKMIFVKVLFGKLELELCCMAFMFIWFWLRWNLLMMMIRFIVDYQWLTVDWRWKIK